MKLRRVCWPACALAALALGGAAPAWATDIEQVLREVAKANPGLLAMGARTRAAHHGEGPAGAWAPPMIELGVQGVPVSGRFDQEPMTMKVVGVSQRVPVFGANGLRRHAAEAETDARGAREQDMTWRMFGSAWRAYAEALAADARVHAAEDHHGVMDRMVEAARARYTAGRGRLEDVLRAEAERARVLADLADFHAQARAAQARLDAVRGRTPGAPPESLAALPRLVVPADADAWRSAIHDTHPELRTFEATARSRKLGARAARRALWPDLQLRAGYGLRETLASGKTQDDMWSAGVGLALPLFARSRELSQAAAMEAMANAAEDDRREAELALLQRVTALHAEAEAAVRDVGLMADTVVVTQQRALEASWSAYTAGTTDLWRVFESSHALYEEELALISARLRRAGAAAELLALTGRGDLVGVRLPESPGSER